MHIIVKSSIHSLEKSIKLLEILTNDELANTSVSPYYSSVGSHLRHIFDIYQCIIDGYSLRRIDLTLRSRDTRVETDANYALNKVKTIIKTLKNIDNLDIYQIVLDDLGLGKVEIEYTLASILAQANSHAIHHYALINYILDRLDIKFDDDKFGFNPTTPMKAKEVKNF